MELNTDGLSILSDVLVAICAVATFIIACFGLSIWKKELQGWTSYELARRIMITVIKIRKALTRARFDLLNDDEFPKGFVLKEGEIKKEDGDAFLHLYDHRWKPIEELLTELEADKIEASILWQWEDTYVIDNLISHVKEYRHAYCKEIGDIKGIVKLSDEESVANRKIIFMPKLDEERDGYEETTYTLISEISKHLQPYLKQKKPFKLKSSIAV